jgi:peptidoglycan-N-acetylglucosamine deacetylase
VQYHPEKKYAVSLEYDLRAVLSLMTVLLVVIALIGIHIIILKQVSRRRYRRRIEFEKTITRVVLGEDPTLLNAAIKQDPVGALMYIVRYLDSTMIPDHILASIRSAFSETAGPRILARYARSPVGSRRLLAARLLRVCPDEDALDCLARSIPRERSLYAAFHAWYTLFFLDDPRVVSIIIEASRRRRSRFFENALRLLERSGPAIRHEAAQLLTQEDPFVQRMLLHIGVSDGDGPIGTFLADAAGGTDTLRQEACEILRRRSPGRINTPEFLAHENPACRSEAIRDHFALTPHIDPVLVDTLLRDPTVNDLAVREVAQALLRLPNQLHVLVDRFSTVEDPLLRRGYARILHSRLPYLITHYLEEDSAMVTRLWESWVSDGRYAGIVDFLTTNRIAKIETTAVVLLQPLVERYEAFRDYCIRYLPRPLAARVGLPESPEIAGRARISLTAWDKAFLVGLLVIALSIFPAIFVVRFGATFPGMNWGYIARRFLIEYNYLFAAYAVALNVSYLLLMIVSGVEMRRQVAEWDTRDERFLFDSGILPGITIIAPAYNEEATAVESVRSLLTLRYPDYSVVVVNDGSRDSTLDTLIRAFDLDRVDTTPAADLSTAPIRGAYRNRHIPNLLVIDKENGGKADALNAGINHAETEYVCCIDADSLLEGDSLLALSYPLIVDNREVVAVGGNIVPINGCRVVHGSIDEIHPPATRLGLMQVIEYLRSFVAGRMGWARMNALLVISGAFGLFRRARVLEIGGYMTGTGQYRRDTVGEDMELVVRLVRHMDQTGAPRAIKYAHNANCWTEVPEEWGALLRQRDRWQRGLIEIMTYYKSMIFNPRYGTAGLLTVPYLFLFELIGPFLEVTGYLVVLLSLLFGLLKLEVVVLLFTATVVLGMLVSVGSLYFAERGILFFKGRDFAQVLGAAFRENFGRRQLLSAHRTFAYVMFLFRNKGWQHLKRRGFAQRAGSASAGKGPQP